MCFSRVPLFIIPFFLLCFDLGNALPTRAAEPLCILSSGQALTFLLLSSILRSPAFPGLTTTTLNPRYTRQCGTIFVPCPQSNVDCQSPILWAASVLKRDFPVHDNSKDKPYLEYTDKSRKRLRSSIDVDLFALL